MLCFCQSSVFQAVSIRNAVFHWHQLCGTSIYAIWVNIHGIPAYHATLVYMVAIASCRLPDAPDLDRRGCLVLVLHWLDNEILRVKVWRSRAISPIATSFSGSGYRRKLDRVYMGYREYVRQGWVLNTAAVMDLAINKVIRRK